MSTVVSKILKAFLILLVPLIVILGTVRLLTTDQYLAFEYGKSSFPPDAFGFTPQQRFSLASTDIHYVSGHLPPDTLARQALQGTPVYNSREVGHMADVRSVFEGVFRAWHLSLFLFVLLAIVLWQRAGLEAVTASIQWSGLLTAAIIAVIAGLALFAWQTWFDLFHRFFFASGSWLFAYSDTLIRLFPLRFWFDAVMTIALISLAVGLLLALVGRLTTQKIA